MKSLPQVHPPNLPATLLLLGLLFLAAWLPRMAQLDAFVTPDERRWLQRSGNFLDALDQGDFASTYQAGHPGVTVMWAGSAGLLLKSPTYAQQVTRPFNEDDFDAWIRANSDLSLLELLVAGRRWIVFAISLTIALAFLPLRKLFGALPAFVAILFVAWEPFHIGLSRQLHPDGLLAALTLLALAAFAAWLYAGQRIRALISAGIAAGLAILTKSPALVVLAVMLLLIALAWLFGRATPGQRMKLVRGALLLVLISALTAILLWPAAWSAPHDPFIRMFNLALEYSEEGHELPLFFWGETVDDPGPLFYPVSLLMRATPATLVGLLCAVIALWRGWSPLDTQKARQAAMALLLFAVVYMAAITVSEKKMDRYLLPAMPVLSVVGAVGWVGVATALTRAAQPLTQRVRWSNVAIPMLALLLLHGLFSALNSPYYLTYYNPLFGGSRSAPAMMMIGWGEGLEEAARWLNQQQLDSKRVVAWYGNGPLSYYLDPGIEVLPFYSGSEATEEYWFNADYAVLYANQWQRQNPSREIIDSFLARTPAFAFSFGGLELVKVYSLQDVPPPEATHLHRLDGVSWNGMIELAGYYLKDTAIFPGERLPLALFWRGVEAMEEDYTLELSVRDAAGQAVWSSTRSPAGIETSDWVVGKLWRDSYTLELPADLAPGEYPVVALFRASDGEMLPEGEQVVVTLSIQQPALVEVDNAQWQGAAIHSIAHVATITAGQSFFVDVNATIESDAPRKLSLRLLNAAGESIAQNDQVFAPTMRFRLVIPEETTPGQFTLVAVLYDPDSLAALPDQQGALMVELSEVEIR